jgi:hypothetical protein
MAQVKLTKKDKDKKRARAAERAGKDPKPAKEAKPAKLPPDAVPRGSVERGREKRRLPVAIADERKIARLANELAKSLHEEQSVEAEQRSANEGFRSRLKEIGQRVKELADSVEKHTELREVECVLYLRSDQSIDVVRTDSAETIENRAAKRDELQDELFPGA